MSASACVEMVDFGMVMDYLFSATHFLINPQPHPKGGGREERERERMREDRRGPGKAGHGVKHRIAVL